MFIFSVGVITFIILRSFNEESSPPYLLILSLKSLKFCRISREFTLHGIGTNDGPVEHNSLSPSRILVLLNLGF